MIHAYHTPHPVARKSALSFVNLLLLIRLEQAPSGAPAQRDMQRAKDLKAE
jgi:hypothetical protein